MPQLNLLRALPKTKRNIQKRAEAKDPAVIAIAKQYGEMYWDGPREYGYGGYRDDGRWHPVARDIIAQYGLSPACACSMSVAARDFWSRRCWRNVRVLKPSVSTFRFMR